MKKIRIGIPNALMYKKYAALMKTFFNKIGCKVIIGPENDNRIVELGKKNLNNEFCLPYKIYVGEAIFLDKTCDYILVPNICNYRRQEKYCSVFSGIYDNIKDKIDKNKLIVYNIDKNISLIKIGIKFCKNPVILVNAYIKAVQNQKIYDINKENEAKNKVSKNDKKKVLIISQYYSILDKYIASKIINIINESNINILLSSNLEKSLAKSYSEYLAKNIKIEYSKEAIGSMYYYLHRIDGIIFITMKNCEIDTEINTIAFLKNSKLPKLNITLDDDLLFDEKKLKLFIRIIKGDFNE